MRTGWGPQNVFLSSTNLKNTVHRVLFYAIPMLGIISIPVQVNAILFNESFGIQGLTNDQFSLSSGMEVDLGGGILMEFGGTLLIS
ncbi:MAG TPA: hypothetical protein VMW55_03475 [Nitrosopumilaceae archaeon]|nr:hypothetical protein [Nitrosopumilaceae archaeon]